MKRAAATSSEDYQKEIEKKNTKNQQPFAIAQKDGSSSGTAPSAEDKQQPSVAERNAEPAATAAAPEVAPREAAAQPTETAAAAAPPHSEEPVKEKEATANTQSNVAAAPPAPPSLFGGLFNQPFTNPFAEAAKLSGPGLSLASGAKSDDDNENEETGGAPSAEKVAAEVRSSRPAVFPGEENDEEVFTEHSAVLYKLIKREGKAAFRRVGEGLLFRLLRQGTDYRIVARRRGTWQVVVNSPLNVSSAFTEKPAGLTFVAPDLAPPPLAADKKDEGAGETNEAGKENEGAATKSDAESSGLKLAVFAVRMSTDAAKQEFLKCVSAAQGDAQK